MLAVILGGAKSVWEDLVHLKSMADPDVVFAINDAGSVYPHDIHFWATLHPEKFPGWAGQRTINGYSAPQKIIMPRSMTRQEMATILYPPASFLILDEDKLWDGSSGLYATKIALDMGYDRIVLCGVPMQSEAAHFFDTASWDQAARYHWAWQSNARNLTPRVRSMSGWTMGLLGRPSSDWLNMKEESR